MAGDTHTHTHTHLDLVYVNLLKVIKTGNILFFYKSEHVNINLLFLFLCVFWWQKNVHAQNGSIIIIIPLSHVDLDVEAMNVLAMLWWKQQSLYDPAGCKNWQQLGLGERPKPLKRSFVTLGGAGRGEWRWVGDGGGYGVINYLQAWTRTCSYPAIWTRS